nr:ribosome biogenesis GTP-binding protein YihA/YsxC [Allobaculum mucilyticum]
MTSASGKEGWPDTDLPEVVVVGRSNVGKSSFINALTNKKKLAYVGSTPGKTQLLNFFDIDNRWILVDVPGYGYAKLSQAQIRKLGTMMDEYFNERQQIACVVSLVDARHAPSEDDKDMLDYFKQTGRRVIIGATKIDKVPKTKRLAALRTISKDLQIPLKNVFPISSVEKSGFDEILEAVYKLLPDASAEASVKSEKKAKPAGK